MTLTIQVDGMGSRSASSPLRPAVEPAFSDLVVVANRLPVKQKGGAERPVLRTIGWETSPGGLVGALAPVLSARTGAWVGWPGCSGPAPGPFDHEGMHLHPVALARSEYEAFYEGFSNATLWPLYHDAIRAPEFRADWWDAYVAVNSRYAERAAAVTAINGSVWVHDYQLQLVPAMLRRLRPDLRIGFFLHIPFPPPELFMHLPWRHEIIEGLLGADVVGFQEPVAAQNFSRLARRVAGATGAAKHLLHGGRRIEVGAFPISIDVDAVTRIAGNPITTVRAAELRRNLGAPTTLLLGVDRLDYTKGIELRLRAFQELLRDRRLKPGECVMVQIAVPSRGEVSSYAEERERIERLVGEINGEFGQMGRPVVHYLHRSIPFPELVALYRAADVMLVTPLRDGMNLVSKEYVAARTDGAGVLVLSEFAGASRELSSALLVNPHDHEGLKHTIEAAVNLDPLEARKRMRSMRAAVRRHDVHAWAAEFLGALNGH